MLYNYQCWKCGQIHEVVQKMKEPHVYVCPRCNRDCSRVFTLPRVKYNKGFYSDTLGRWVHSHKDFDKGLTQVRYETDMAKFVGDNSTPKDEWIERKEKKLKTQHKYMAGYREALEQVDSDAQRTG